MRARYLSPRLVGLLVFGPLLLLFPACASASPPASPPGVLGGTAAPPTAAPELRKVTMGYTPNMSMAPLYVAYEKGYYREQGLDVSLQTLPGGSDMVTQTASGNFDVGVGGPGAGLFNAFARGIRLTVVTTAAVFKPPVAAMLVGSKLLQDQGELRGIADLRGRAVSVIGKGTANEYLVDQALRRGGLTIDDVDIQVVPAPEAVTALANGAIAAGLISEPFASEATARGVGVVLNNEYVDDFISVIMYFNETFAQDRREDGIRLLTAFYRAARDLQPPYKAEDVALIAQYTRLGPETIRSAARPYHEITGDVHMTDMEAIQRFVMARGETTYAEPLTLANFVDPTFSQEALRRLGQ